jgi:hypothetical protein
VKRHIQQSYYIEGEGLWTLDDDQQPRLLSPDASLELRLFRFSRLGPMGQPTDPALNQKLAKAMTTGGQPDSSAGGQPPIPAGFTYLGQFVDHDLTLDATAVALGTDVTVDELVDNRSPALDLDSVYGRGPLNLQDRRRFYAGDGIKLKTGTTTAIDLSITGITPDPTNPNPPASRSTNVNLDGFDLPRVGAGATKAAQRAPLIPDTRNDENLAVAQTHLAFIHFHNRVVDTLAARGVPGILLFEAARGEVVQHYQWMLRHDHLPRIVDPDIVDDVFTHGRKFFEVFPAVNATMPIEFSVAAYRLGHSMVRGAYQWNRLFRQGSPLGLGTLFRLFTFTGTSGNLTITAEDDVAQLDDPNSGTNLTLPTNWIVDWRRLHDFTGTNLAAPLPPDGLHNEAKRIDTRLVNPLDHLPAGTFAGREQNVPQGDIQRNLAFRNLTRANMVKLASGQQMADCFHVKQLTPAEILTGNGTGGVNLTTEGQLSQAEQDALAADTPLWFYILREAEVGGGRLGAVGGRIVAEVFHRAMEVSTFSIVRNPLWRPQFGPDPNTFRMVDLLLFAFNNNLAELNPLGDA